MKEIDVAEMKRELAQKLIDEGVPEEKANQLACKEIESLGTVKTLTGKCPLEGASPMACTLCVYGHMTECHYPVTCEEANCSHYQAEAEDAGEYAGFLEEGQ